MMDWDLQSKSIIVSYQKNIIFTEIIEEVLKHITVSDFVKTIEKLNICPGIDFVKHNNARINFHVIPLIDATDATSNNKISLAPTSQISSTGNKYSTEIVDPIVFQSTSSENSIEIPDSEEIPSTSRENPEKIERRRGQHKRYSNTNVFKTQVIMELENGAKPAELVARYRVNRSLISKWLKNKIEISQAAVGEHKNMLRIRKSQKYNDLFKELRDVFMVARENGRPVDYNWLWSKGRNIYKKQQGQDAILRKHVIVTFIKRNHLKLRRAQRNKKLPKEHYRNSLKQWHATMRESLIRTGKRDNYDSKFGRYTPMQRFM